MAERGVPFGILPPSTGLYNCWAPGVACETSLYPAECNQELAENSYFASKIPVRNFHNLKEPWQLSDLPRDLLKGPAE